MNVLGMWVWPQNVQYRGAEKVAESCAQAGVTDLYFLTKGLAGTTSFLSRIAPAVCERDLLRELLEAAHKRRLRVHAWFTSASDEYYKQLHPESGRYHFVRGRDRGLISLADENYLAYMQHIVQDVCRRYDVDGIHLDYIRYNHLLYGWSQEDLQRYQAQGADTAALKTMIERTFYGSQDQCIFDAYRNGNENVLALARARRGDVVRFARTITQTVRAENRRIILSAALMPEGAYDDTAFSDLHYGQNYGDASELFDVALPMAYSHAYKKDEQWVAAVAEGTLRRGMRTVVGLHAYEGGTAQTLKRDLAAVKTTAAEGVCLFREGATALAWLNGRKVILENTLNEAITEIEFSCKDERLSSRQIIEEGRKVTLDTPFIPETLRVFCEKKEVCLFLCTNPK